MNDERTPMKRGKSITTCGQCDPSANGCRNFEGRASNSEIPSNCPLEDAVAVPERIKEIAQEMRTQDNRITSDPMFVARRARLAGKKQEVYAVCFTGQGCDDFIKANSHNLRNPEVYVDSGSKSPEWKAVREFLLGIGEEENSD